MTSWCIVGISGVTCGGKTSLCDRLCSELPFDVKCFHQDDYFLPEDSDKLTFIPELNHANWDILSSLDMDTMSKHINAATNTPPTTEKGVLILDGNLILNYEPIARICNLKYYFVLDKETCRARRKKRVYQPPDGPESFDKCVWPMYEMYKAEVEQMQDIFFLDGCQDRSIIFQIVLDDIMLHVRRQ